MLITVSITPTLQAYIWQSSRTDSLQLLLCTALPYPLRSLAPLETGPLVPSHDPKGGRGCENVFRLLAIACSPSLKPYKCMCVHNLQIHTQTERARERAREREMDKYTAEQTLTHIPKTLIAFSIPNTSLIWVVCPIDFVPPLFLSTGR